NIAIQLKSLGNEIDLAKIQLQLLLNTAIRYEPVSEDLLIDVNPPLADMDAEAHPKVLLSAREVERANALLKLEKSKLLPNLSAGYSNQSFHDLNNNRFSSVEIGIGIPIFASGQKAQIKAEAQRVAFAENELVNQKTQWKTAYETVLSSYRTQRQIVDDYRTKQLPRARQVADAAKEQFDNGEIDYLDWVMLNNQATQIQNDYYLAVMLLNQSIITLQYLTSN
ncbi:TolC family protein, partial [Parapedobacter defluvii]|uniref:TolC family protein n=1 Tax=Parapedobacter defluvii TaxID=2045106 RepID=UPI0016662ADD